MTPPINRRPERLRLVLPRMRELGVLAAATLLPMALVRPLEAQLARQTFEVNLGSGAIPGPLPFDEPFFLSAAAPENLLQVRLWAVRESELTRPNCSRVTPAEKRDAIAARDSADKPGARIPIPLTSSWSRAGLDSLTRFDLQAEPLSPNRDYTFCFHLLRKPTAVDSAGFSVRATRNITAVFAVNAGKVISSDSMLNALHHALIKALPAADTVVFLESPSIFEEVKNEPDSIRIKRLNRLIALATSYLQTTRAHNRFIITDSARVVTTNAALTAVVTNPALLRLAAISDAIIPAGLDSTRLLATAMLASRVTRFTPGDIALISQGLYSLDGSPRPGAFRDLATVTASATLTSYADSLARTRSALRDIASLAALAAERSGPATSTELEQLLKHLTVALDAVDFQMQNLSNLSASVEHRADLVQGLVASVRTLDFARIALRSTTSDTYKARANTYISLDAGLMTAADVNQVVPYLGVNFYVRPVNKNAPLGRCFCPGRRASLTLGITTGSIADTDRIADTFTGHSIFTGLGVRITDYWRLSGGLLLVRTYRDEPPSELRFGAVPGLATSLDIDVVGLLGKVGTLLFP